MEDTSSNLMKSSPVHIRKFWKIPKEAVNRRRSDNAMATKKRKTEQTSIYKPLHRKLSDHSYWCPPCHERDSNSQL